MDELERDNPDLFASAREWIQEGWGYNGDISPLMIAAALEKEALTQDKCVVDGDNAVSFPRRLRHLAAAICYNEGKRLMYHSLAGVNL